MTPDPVIHDQRLALPTQQAFATLTEGLGRWWPLLEHGLCGASAATLALDGGAIVERCLDGTAHRWAEVVAMEPPHRLQVRWNPGRQDDPSAATDLVWTIRPEGDARTGPRADADADAGTSVVTVRHDGWARATDGEARRGDYDVGWPVLLWLLAEACRGDGSGQADVATLRRGLGTVADALEAAGDRPAATGWGSLRIGAHVLLSTRQLAAIADDLLARRASDGLDGPHTQHLEVLDATAAEHGGSAAALADALRAATHLAVARLGAMDLATLDTPVPARIEHDGILLHEGPLTMRDIAAAHGGGHAAMHAAQLAALEAP
jgi:uncharacterized protein YndB with AHSA1/START domain